MLEDSLDFRSEDERAINRRVVKRVDAEMIAGEEESAVLPVVNDKGKLAVDLVKEVHAMLLVEMKQDLNIRSGSEPMALCDQSLFQLDVVEDLAIAQQHHGTVFVVYRLIATLQIDNAQTPEAQRHRVVDEVSGGVGTAMDQLVGHAHQQLSIRLALAAHINETSKTTHVNF